MIKYSSTINMKITLIFKRLCISIEICYTSIYIYLLQNKLYNMINEL